MRREHADHERVDAFGVDDALLHVRRIRVPLRSEGGRRELERRRIMVLTELALKPGVQHVRLLPYDDAKPMKFSYGDLAVYRSKETDRGEA